MKQDTVIVSPLDWGLGHAARCIPVIRQLKAEGYIVIIAGSGRSMDMLKIEFPELQTEQIPTKTITYSKHLPAYFKIIFQLPVFIKNIITEKKTAQRLIAKYKPIFLISDNRYGFYSRQLYSYFITHQLYPLLPNGLGFFQPVLNKLHGLLIRRFNKICIPDYAGLQNLSGKLSHRTLKRKKVYYKGPLSRFSGQNLNSEINSATNIVAIISGPEPQRTVFYNKVLKQSQMLTKPILILEGIPGTKKSEQIENVTICNHMPTDQLAAQIVSADYVICRSGYSSVMDLVVLKKKAMLVPTPGQTEQEYLAEHLQRMNIFKSTTQHEFNLEDIDKQMQNFEPNFEQFVTKS
ncbi:MAG: glycosyltransferase [Bacteroidota bacterium]|nr:glycosyltransferase [Bacteroidota bacterium]